MPYKSIKFDNVPLEMLDILEPLFKEVDRSAKDKNGKSGGILVQIFRDGHGSAAFIPSKGARAIDKIVKGYHRKRNKK